MSRQKVLLQIIILTLVWFLAIGCGNAQILFVTPTPLPTSTPTPLPDLSVVVLALEDLPSGFETISLDELGITKEDLVGDDLKVESIFTFLEAENFELVMGVTTLLPNRLDQVGFDIVIRQQDFLMESWVAEMGVIDILEQMYLPDLNDIGDASAGTTIVADVEGITMCMDMVVFRRDKVGSVILVMYIDGDIPVVTVDTVAIKLDDRIVEVLQLSE